jgi:hypothetical protein
MKTEAFWALKHRIAKNKGDVMSEKHEEFLALYKIAVDDI